MKTFQEFISEAKKCWPGYKKKGTQKLFGKTYNRCVKEGKVEWDNPKRPLKSGFTPREKNRMVRKRLETKGLGNSGGKSFTSTGPSERDYERHGSLTLANQEQSGVKTPKKGLHKFKDNKGQTQRKKYKSILSNLKEPKESFDYSIQSDRRTKVEVEEFEYELEESSTGERSGRRTRGKVTLARGRGADMERQERTTAAIAKKAGLKGTGKYSTKDLRTKSKDYTTYDSEDDLDDIGSTEQDHFIRTYSSARKAAKGEHLIKKYKPAGKTPTGMTRLKTAPSSESVRRVKDLKKQITKSGANKRGSVHTVDIMHRDSGIVKNDPDKQMERGRNFIAAIKDTPNQLKKAGAKKGEAVTGRPSAVMPGETTDLKKKKTGEEKRAKLYKKIFGKRSTEKSAKTGLMVGKVDK